MASNIFWGWVFVVDLGGTIGLLLAAMMRWPWLIHRLELVFYGAGCLLVVVLLVAFVLTRIHEASWRGGEIISGLEYHDWRD